MNDESKTYQQTIQRTFTHECLKYYRSTLRCYKTTHLESLCASYPYFRVDIMVGFFIPGDPYFPNKGNGGWIEEDPEEDPEEI